jgi:hypothetical protein
MWETCVFEYFNGQVYWSKQHLYTWRGSTTTFAPLPNLDNNANKNLLDFMKSRDQFLLEASLPKSEYPEYEV